MANKKLPDDERRDNIVQIYINRKDLDVLNEAVRIEGSTRSDFIKFHALRASNEAIKNKKEREMEYKVKR